ncbi:hypothetical protein IQ07DRAFT_368095 [Pyrenochaeta sp. DS3sAY3a]|nr:hypothetical protein IQ07DRAFT_368095 [Pyrenochaeta sp. DS3sAY3a]
MATGKREGKRTRGASVRRGTPISPRRHLEEGKRTKEVATDQSLSEAIRWGVKGLTGLLSSTTFSAACKIKRKMHPGARSLGPQPHHPRARAQRPTTPRSAVVCIKRWNRSRRSGMHCACMSDFVQDILVMPAPCRKREHFKHGGLHFSLPVNARPRSGSRLRSANHGYCHDAC